MWNCEGWNDTGERLAGDHWSDTAGAGMVGDSTSTCGTGGTIQSKDPDAVSSAQPSVLTLAWSKLWGLEESMRPCQYPHLSAHGPVSIHITLARVKEETPQVQIPS